MVAERLFESLSKTKDSFVKPVNINLRDVQTKKVVNNVDDKPLIGGR